MQKKVLKKSILMFNVMLFAACFKVNAQQNTNLINSTFASEQAKHGWTASDTRDYLISDQYTDEQTGLTHTYVQQRHQGVIVYNAISVFLIQNNKVLSFAPGIVNNIDKKVKTATPVITAEAAISYALKHLERSTLAQVKLVSSDQALNRFVFEAPEISASPIKVQLVYRAIEEEVFLAWDVSIEMISEPHWWNVRVNALNGAYIDKNDFTKECSFGNSSNDLHTYHLAEDAAATAPVPMPFPPPPLGEYNVYAFPVEAPSFGARTNLINPEDLTASPFGWHDDNGVAGNEYTITRGNNVHAYEDANNDNLPGYSPNSATLQFNYPVDLTQAPLVNQDASLANLFYDCNRIHDVLNHAGFTAAAGNFQQNNYGLGGLGNDYVKAEGFDGSGSNNANFSTPADGSSGRMQMYLWTAPTPDRDGSFDNGIVAHEYGHGVSNRLTGGPSQAGCLGNAEQGGEGWSDWLALMMSTEAGDTVGGGMLTQARGIGTYALNQPTTGQGIRRFRYSVNMAINPQTYADLATSGTGPHPKGEIWCDAIWDMSSFLINDYGFNPDPSVATAGNNIAMRLVLEGMKLQPCSPGYLDARDAILTAEAVLYGNVHRCRIWEAFARRGMGFSAIQGSSGSSTDQTAAFNMPTFCLIATQAPVAAFTSNTNTVSCAGTVQFTDQSVQPFSWLWNFGDLTTSTLQNPTHQFNAPGTYTVKLVVTNPLGSDSVTHTITVTPTFTAAVTATPASVCNGSTVALNAVGSGSTNYSYNLTGISFAPVSGTPITGPQGDDIVSSFIPIGFNFPFYNTIQTQLKISTNGFISFNSNSGSGCCQGAFLPNNSNTLSNLIAVCWTDLFIGSPNTLDYFNLTSPNRFVIRWSNVAHCCATTPAQVTAQIILYETGEIEMHNTSIVPSTVSADVMTMGIENATGTSATVVPGRNGTLFSASNEAYRFTPAVNYTYNWQPGNLNGAAQTVTPVSSGTYTVNVGDGSGCIIPFTSPLITVNPLPTPVIGGSLAICSGSSTTLNAGSYSSYSWSTGETTQTKSANTAGTFTVTVTDGNGCTGSTSAVTIVNASPAPVISGILSFCAGGSTSLNTGVFAGYNWSTGATTQTISVNSAGSFTVTVTDGNGCTGSNSVTTTTSVCCNISLSGIANAVSCNNSNSGSIDVSSSNIFGSPSYVWDNGSTTEDRSGLTAGTYTVTVTYGAGCTQSQSFVVNLPVAVSASGTLSNIACRGTNTGSITMAPSGGTPPYTYLWNNGSTSQNRSLLVAGTYTVTVKDVNLCTAVSSFTITQPATNLIINTNKTNIRCFGGLTGVITAAPLGGVTPYNYSWNTFPVKTTATISGLAVGVYTCTVTDFAGCIKSVTITITQPTPLVVVPSQINASFPGAANGAASVAVSGGTPAYNYSWNTVPVQTTSGITGLTAGVYKCTVSDSKSCQVKLTFTITEPNGKQQINVDNMDKELKMFIFPNPSDGLVNIKISGQKDSENINFRLFDISGRLVYDQRIQWIGDEERLFDFSALPKGVYYIKCVSEKNNLIQKIVIQ